MKLRRLSARAFRAIRESVALEGLGSGLNLVAADNEAGKSTLLDALRTVLFERHRVGGNVAARMLPYESKVRPEIEAELEIGGGTVTIRKAFVQKPEAELRTPGGAFEGDEAEKELAALLGHRIPARGESTPEHQGVHALLWVSQGDATRLDWNDPARSKLEAALERQVGEVLGGPRGERLLARVRAMHEEHIDKRGLPRGARKKIADQIGKLEAELASLDATMRAFDDTLDALDRDEKALAELRESGRVETAGRAFRELEEALVAFRAVETKKNEAEQLVRVARAELDKLAAEKLARDQRIDEMAATRRLVDRATAETAEAEQAVSPAKENEERARRKIAERTKAAQEAKETLATTERRARLAEQTDQLATKKKLRRSVAKKERAIAALRERIAATPVDDATVTRLVALREATRIAEARVEAAATVVTPDVDVPVVDDSGRAWPRGEPARVIETTTLRIGAHGTIRIEPANAGQSERAAAHAKAEAELRAALDAAGFDEVEAATAAAEARRRDEADLRAAERELLFDVPRGLDALDDEIERLAAEVAPAVGPDGSAPDPREAELARTRAKSALEVAERVLEEDRRAHEEAAATLARAREAWLEHRSRLLELQRQAKELEERLAVARGAQDDDTLRAKIAEATAKLDAATASHTSTVAATEAAGGAHVRERHEEAKRAYEGAAENARKLEQRIREHRIALAHSAAQETGERRAEVVADLERSRTEQRRIERTARSVELLQRTLEAIASEGRSRFLEPVVARVRPYLERLLPDATLEVDAGLRLVGLRRGAIVEPYETLSMGTQEQLAVLARLAFADLLAEEGEAPPIVLDDALVYSDPDRFGRMKAILASAAERHQIVVLTCRGDLWVDVPANRVTMVHAVTTSSS